MDTDLRKAWLKGGRDFQTHRGLYMATHALHGEIGRTPKRVLLNNEQEWVEHFFTALRFLVEGEPGMGHTYMRIKMPEGPDDSSGHTSHPMWNLPFQPASGIVTEQHIREAESFVSTIKARKVTNQNVALALRRFNYSYARHLAADTFLDLTVALETLFAADGAGEIGYKVAARTSRLLSTPPKREDLDLAKGLYRIRSEIVHGGHYERIHESKTLSRFLAQDASQPLTDHAMVMRSVRKARTFVRKSLVAYLRHPDSTDPIAMVRQLDLA